jgi:DNA-binding FadR family transcriptional regulator
VVAPGLELAAVLRPVRAGNAFEETVERLLTVIRLGLVGPGEKFPAERDLAGQLGVSRLTLREALRALQQAGFVESRRGRFGGTFVTASPPVPGRAELLALIRADAGKLDDVLAYRMAIDTGAAQLLAQSFASGSFASGSLASGSLAPGSAGPGGDSAAPAQAGPGAAEAVLADRLAALVDAGPQDYRRLDTMFHLAIAELTGSALLATACADARMRTNDLLNAIPLLPRNIDHTAAQHAEIVAAIVAGDPERARRAIAEHLDGTGALLRGFLA